MARILISQISITDQNEQSDFSQPASVGDTSLVVQNSVGFAVNDYLVLGNPGDESTEIVKIASISTNTIGLVSAMKQSHTIDSSVANFPYNQFKVYSSTLQTGPFTLLNTIDMKVDNPLGTQYNDATGTSTTWYEVSFYNSTTSAESSKSDEWQPTLSGNLLNYTLRAMQDRVIVLADDRREEKVKRDEVTIWINEAYQKAQNYLRRKDQKYAMKSTAALSFTAGTAEYTLPTDLYQLFRVDVAMNGATQYRHATYMDLRDDDPLIDNAYSDLDPVFYFIAASIGFKPTPSSTGTYKLWYYPQPLTLVNDADQLDDPFKSYADIFVDYALFKFFTKEYDSTRRTEQFQMWQAGLQQCIEDLAGRQINSPMGVAVKDPAYMLSLEEEIYRP
jgi:hypothetical protein